MTLNMVRLCRSNPLMSACTALEGKFNYVYSLLALLGSLAIAITTPSQRVSWTPHGASAWVIGPAIKHYRCLTLHAPKTRGSIAADAFRWSETYVLILPKITIDEQITNAALSLSQDT